MTSVPVEVITSVQRRRRWSSEEKRRRQQSSLMLWRLRLHEPIISLAATAARSRARDGDAGVCASRGCAGCGGVEPDRGGVREWLRLRITGTADPATASAIIKALAKDVGRR